MRITPFSLFILITISFVIPSIATAETSFEFFFNSENDYRDAIVQDVLTTDTILIESLARKGEKIRLIGLKAIEPPETKGRVEKDKFGFPIKEEVSPLESLEERSLRFAKELLIGQEIRIEFDKVKKDENFQTIAYIFLTENDTFVNTEILRQGYAHLSLNPRNRKYNKELRAAYQESRREKRGLQGQ